MTLRALPPDELPAIASRFVRFQARGLRKMCRSPPLLESLRRSHPSGPESLPSHPDRKVRGYCDVCGLGAREEIPGQMDDFALTTPRGAAICTSCANRELKSGQTLMQWLEVHQEGARAGSCIPFKDQ